MTISKKLTSEKEDDIKELRRRVKHIIPQNLYEDDSTFLRFLTARNFDIKAAELMLKKHIEMRKIFQADDIVTDYKCPEVLQKYISQNFIGFDKKRNIVKYSAIGNVDGKGIMKLANKLEILRCFLLPIEKDLVTLREEAGRTGNPVSQCIFIYDMEGLTLAKATDKSSLELFTWIVGLFQDNYPELLKSIYVINAMSLFELVFPVVKVVLSTSIIGKMKVFGKEGWKEELLREIDSDVLPAFLGGTRTDPDGDRRCSSFINFAGPVPQECYLTKNVDIFGNLSGVNRKIVPKQSAFNTDINVQHPGSLLQFEFETRINDIGFKVELHTTSKVSDIVPFARIETEYAPHKGTVRCKYAGKYRFVFDNTYSWFQSKELYYLIKVHNPEKEISTYQKSPCKP